MFLYLFNLMVIVLEFGRLMGQIAVAFFHRLYQIYIPKPRKSVAGKVVLVTGAAQGLGAELARQFAKLGATLVLWDVNKEGLERTALDIRKNGGRVSFQAVDVSDPRRVEIAADQVHANVGDVHVLINNAAILHCKPFADLSTKDIQDTVNTNLLSHYWTTQAFLPDMLTLGEGHIVAISSNLGIVGKSHFCDYSASKYGINGFMEALSDELHQMGKGGVIKLTTVCPAVINTGLSRAVETRFPSIFSIMSAEYAARKIISAVLRNETFLVIPRAYRYLYAFTRNLPRRVQQLLLDYIGNTVEID